MPRQKRYKTKYPGVYFIEGSTTSGKKEHIYYIYYRKDNKQIEEKAGWQFKDNMTPAKASQMRIQRIEGKQLPNKEHRELQKHEVQNNENLNLDGLFDLFLKNKSHLKSLKDDRIRYYRHIQGVIGNKLIEDITSFDTDNIRDSLYSTHKPATIKQVLVLLKRIVNFGVGKNISNPLNFKIDMPKVNNIKTEDLTSEQLKRLLKILDEENNTAAKMMKLALCTGMRRGELFRLNWDDIDFEKGFITIRDPKGGIDQNIPLNESAKIVFMKHTRTISLFVFPGKTGKQMKDNRTEINKIKKKANLPKDFRPLHGLRHVYASMLASSGEVDLYTLQKLLTHKSPQMTQRYAHLRDDALRKASNLAGEIIMKVSKESK